jgi:YegS/Rv2252/BmrU family lipid kinase
MLNMSFRAKFIINPAAGANRTLARWTRFEAQLRRHGIEADKAFTTGQGDATRQARKAALNYDLLVAVGGDGTISEVADGILSCPNSQAVLGLLPFGTGNDVAEVLGIQIHTDALQCLIAGQTKYIDAIQIQCQSDRVSVVRHSLLFAGVGIISESLKKTTARCKKLFGQRMAYPVGLVRALWSYQSPLMRVNCDGRILDERFLFVGASNTPIAGGGMKIAPNAKVDDGLLNINLIQAVGRWQALLQLRRLCRGRHTNHPNVHYLLARDLKVDAPLPLEVAADGDLVGHTPAQILVRPKALRVRVP